MDSSDLAGPKDELAHFDLHLGWWLIEIGRHYARFAPTEEKP